MEDIKFYICPNCGSKTFFKEEKNCWKCLSQIGNKPLSEMTENGLKREYKIICGLNSDVQNMVHVQTHKKQLEKILNL